ncbi:KTSC domain-containing protein [Paraburkholderia antibiotica]|uniref:KTSC domain-containing protein n=1 Tax=Paraburkholderia antibiotica TaxID=2728839 RepID=A0A7Y0FFV8_9BURK|nr:KTSC domain-containing protein [Paraburkholderia antibiotica]NML34547.1 KTSC domain-containing protein [Paraburkholderia antibiotica]
MNNKPSPVIAMSTVKSSQIHSIGYDPASQTLAVRFKDRATDEPTSLYHYSGVTPANFDALKGAESIGSHFYKHIKPHKERFPYVCVEKKPAGVEKEQA